MLVSFERDALVALVLMPKYLHLPSIFPIKCVGGRVYSWVWLHRYANQHSAIYIVLLSAYEDIDVNG